MIDSQSNDSWYAVVDHISKDDVENNDDDYFVLVFSFCSNILNCE